MAIMISTTLPKLDYYLEHITCGKQGTIKLYLRGPEFSLERDAQIFWLHGMLKDKEARRPILVTRYDIKRLPINDIGNIIRDGIKVNKPKIIEDLLDKVLGCGCPNKRD